MHSTIAVCRLMLRFLFRFPWLWYLDGCTNAGKHVRTDARTPHGTASARNSHYYYPQYDPLLCMDAISYYDTRYLRSSVRPCLRSEYMHVQRRYMRTGWQSSRCFFFLFLGKEREKNVRSQPLSRNKSWDGIPVLSVWPVQTITATKVPVSALALLSFGYI